MSGYDLGLDYRGGVNRPTASDIGKIVVVDSIGTNFAWSNATGRLTAVNGVLGVTSDTSTPAVYLSDFLPSGFNRATDDASPYIREALAVARIAKLPLDLGVGDLHVYTEIEWKTEETREFGPTIYGHGEITRIYAHDADGAVFRILRDPDLDSSHVPLAFGPVIRNMYIVGSGGRDGIRIESCLLARIEDIRAETLTGSAVRIDPQGNDLNGGGSVAGHSAVNVEVRRIFAEDCDGFAVDGLMPAGVGDIRNITCDSIYTLRCGGGIRGSGIGWVLRNLAISYSTTYYDVEMRRMLSPGTVTNAIGTSLGGVTITGTPLKDWHVIRIVADSTSTIKWSLDGGTNYVATGVTPGASLSLTGTGLTAHFPTSTWTNADAITSAVTGVSAGLWQIEGGALEGGAVGGVRVDGAFLTTIRDLNLSYNTPDSGRVGIDLGTITEGAISSTVVKNIRAVVASGHDDWKTVHVGPKATVDFGPSTTPAHGSRLVVETGGYANIIGESGPIGRPCEQQNTVLGAPGTFTPNMLTGASFYLRVNAGGNYTIAVPTTAAATAGAKAVRPGASCSFVILNKGVTNAVFTFASTAGGWVADALTLAPNEKGRATFELDPGSEKWEQSTAWNIR